MKTYNKIHLFLKSLGILVFTSGIFILNFIPFLNLDFWFLVVSAYLMGSVPYGFLLAKWAGLGNLQELGSGNIGATNALRTGDKYVAALTLLFDFSKGLIVSFILILALRSEADFENLSFINDFVIYMISILVILGHIFPIWLKLKGGKGVATALGVLAVCDPYVFGSILAVWFISYKITKTSSMSALIAFVSVSLINFVFSHFMMTIDQVTESKYWNYIFTQQSAIFVMIIMFIILLSHIKNIMRILKKQEDVVVV